LLEETRIRAGERGPLPEMMEAAGVLEEAELEDVPWTRA